MRIVLSRYSLTTLFDCNLSIIIIFRYGHFILFLTSFPNLSIRFYFIAFLSPFTRHWFLWTETWNYRCNYNFWHMSIYSLLLHNAFEFLSFSLSLSVALFLFLFRINRFFFHLCFDSVFKCLFIILFWFVDTWGHLSHRMAVDNFFS